MPPRTDPRGHRKTDSALGATVRAGGAGTDDHAGRGSAGCRAAGALRTTGGGTGTLRTRAALTATRAGALTAAATLGRAPRGRSVGCRGTRATATTAAALTAGATGGLLALAARRALALRVGALRASAALGLRDDRLGLDVRGDLADEGDDLGRGRGDLLRGGRDLGLAEDVEGVTALLGQHDRDDVAGRARAGGATRAVQVRLVLDGRVDVHDQLDAVDVHAARGVHVDGVELVVHVDPPVEHKAYLHRSGRTARAGSAGDVVTIMLPEQRRDTLDILRKAKISATPQQVTSASPEVVALVGEVAPYVKPEPVVAQPQGGGRSQGANAQRKRAARGEGQQPAGRSGGQGGGGRRRGAGAAASDAPAAGRAPQGGRGGQRSGAGRGQGGAGAQRSGAAAGRPQGAGRSASGTPTTGMVVGARTPRTNRRAQG